MLSSAVPGKFVTPNEILVRRTWLDDSERLPSPLPTLLRPFPSDRSFRRRCTGVSSVLVPGKSEESIVVDSAPSRTAHHTTLIVYTYL